MPEIVLESMYLLYTKKITLRSTHSLLGNVRIGTSTTFRPGDSVTAETSGGKNRPLHIQFLNSEGGDAHHPCNSESMSHHIIL